MVEFDRSAFIGKFQEEAQELLQRLNEGVITLEGDPENRELIDQMMRDAHTIKGSSRMVGLIEISDVAHWLEDIMVKVRDGDMKYTPQMSDYFFEALDAIVYLADNKGVNEGDVLDLDGLKSKLAALADGGTDAAKAAEAETAEAAANAAAEPAPKKRSRKKVAEPVQELDDELPDDDDDDAHEAVETERVTQDAAPKSRSSAGKNLSPDELKTKVQATIRIKTAQVDSLLNLISEVVIGQIKAEQRANEMRVIQSGATESWQAWARIRSMLAALGESGAVDGLAEDVNLLDGSLANSQRALSEFVKVYSEDVSRTSLVVTDLQEQGMRLRMLPANTIFQTFPRAVRDLAKQFKKEIDFQIEGGETELDKKVLEEINDPLVHIMRNCVDHGVEDPETRKKLGKPAVGHVKLEARQEGDRIIIEITDDGAGIDPDKVRESAVRKGYLTEAEASAMSDREAKYLIFEAGFSTAAIITEISGRGVGMDVVREFVVEKLKGSLDVESEVGKGTTFKLTIPLTLAIIRALMIRVGEKVFAMPTGSIDETLRVDPAEIIKVEGREVIRRQRRTIPLVRLSEILGVPVAPAEGMKQPIVTISYSGHRMGFMVDGFVGEQQIVIKPLGSHLKKIDNVAGVTILGAGEVVPILNIPDLMTNARTRSGHRAGPTHRDESEGPRSVLICEDSFTTRELERSIFEAAGYQVETAVDGAQGYAKLHEGLKVDAVVTDVQMPNMTGFELTKAIKSDPSLMSIPVIIVTSLERDEEKAEGIEAGADAYITKSVFNQDTLLETVERLIR
ncbi:MAG: hybrid sensor histidine kinase/response regulator [Coriobacteriia bacterium]|nr:hybrid sensor histidine kinase/response regulator [Coriobacteriia bacterium]